MQLKTLQETDVSGKTVLLRVDYNIPLKEKKGSNIIQDDTRIRASIPTLQYLLEKNCKIVIFTYAGRPGGKVVEALRLNPMAEHLQQLLGQPVKKLDQLVGAEVIAAIEAMQPGEIVMLENTRFHPGEDKNDKKLAKELAELGDIMVNDAFSQSHRDQASISGIANYIPVVAGLHLQKEVEMLSQLTNDPKRPFVAIVGGAKVSDKVEVIRRLSKIADVVLVGGGVANNFLKAEGIDVYKSYLEDTVVDKKKHGKSFVAVADELLEDVKREKMILHDYIPLPRIIYPSDVIAADDMHKPKAIKIIDLTTEENGVKRKDYMFLDIGPKTQRLFKDIIAEARTVFWNGPMGVFEERAFEDGTKAVASAMAKSPATTIVGGGDTIAALHHFNLSDRYDYVSAAGGASLEFLSGVELPGLTPMVKK